MFKEGYNAEDVLPVLASLCSCIGLNNILCCMRAHEAVDVFKERHHAEDVLPFLALLCSCIGLNNTLCCMRADEAVDVFKEGHNAEDVLPDLVARALRAAQERSEADAEELAALVAHELEFMRTLVSGSALSEHMVRAGMWPAQRTACSFVGNA